MLQILGAVSALVSLAAAIQNPAVFKPRGASTGEAVAQISQSDAILNLADELDVSGFYSVPETADFEAISLGKSAEDSQRPTVVVVVNGVDQPAEFMDSPVFEVDTRDDRHNYQMARFFAEIPAKLARLGYAADRVSHSISVFSREGSAHHASTESLDEVWAQLSKLYEGYSEISRRAIDAIGDKQFVAELTQLHLFLTKQAAQLSADDVVLVTLNSLAGLYRKESYSVCKTLVREVIGKTDLDVTVVAMPVQQKTVSQFGKRAEKTVRDDDSNSTSSRNTTVYSELFEAGGIRSLNTTSGSAQICFTEKSACEDGTNSCSGHGKCAAVGDCWHCQCTPTVKDKKTTVWAGAACEKKDVVAPFHLIFWTTLFIAIAGAVGIKFLFQCGEAELPGVLQAATVQTKRAQ